MMESPWDGASRRPLRVGLAAIAMFSVAFGAYDAHQLASRPSTAKHAPAEAIALFGAAPFLAVVVVMGAAFAVLFARRPAALGAGIGLFAVMGWLTEAITALANGPRREYFALGVVLAGWLFGLAYARLRHGHAEHTPGEADESLAEAGAVAGIATTYVSAVMSKLSSTGLGWADDTSLRGMILSHHRIDDTSVLGAYVELIVAHPSFSRGLMIATLILQATAFLYVVGPRLRAAYGVALFAFHTNVSFLAHIGYVESRALLLLFSFPWPWIVARLRGQAPPEARPERELDPSRHRAAALGLSVGLFVASLFGAWRAGR